jgi:hypothetical protein
MMDARAVHGGSYRFVPTAKGLTDLFRRYEEERSLGGMASALLRVSPSQRVDTIVTILGLNATGGWRRAEGESAKELWLRYLTPVLAETRESAAALAFALDGSLPGAFEPPIDSPPAELQAVPLGLFTPPPVKQKPSPPPAWRLWLAEKVERLRFALADWRARALVLTVLLIALGVAWPLGLGDAVRSWLEEDKPVCTTCPIDPDPIGPGPIGPRPDNPEPNPDDPVGDDYRAALAVTIAAVDQHNGSITPRALAQIYAGESDFIADAETFLTIMLKRWPEDPDTPLQRNPAGRHGLTQYASAFATLEYGRPVTARPLERNTAEDAFLRDQLSVFSSGGEAEPARPVAASTWPEWLPWLAFLPLLPALVIAAVTFRPAARASLTNPGAGQRGKPIELPLDGLIVSAPAPERRLAREIAWREPVAGRRVHGEKSIRATLARGGFLTPVMRRRRLLAEYVFLVPRRRIDDHERDRVSRFIDALARGGLSVQAYDYDPDPRSLMPRSDETFSASFDLRGLRERHPDARLVLVTDGTELVDYFTLKPLPFVAEELAKWPSRMLLTPVPMAEWGEREMNIADALGGLVGRATPDGFRDLATAFGDRPKPPPRPVSASRLPAGEKGMIQRVVSWLVETERRLGVADNVTERPSAVRFDDPALRSDAPPPEAEIKALLRDLHRWLGPRGFHWLAACAVYPQLRFGLTVYLGLKVTVRYGAVAMPLFSEKLLAQLTLLPWFRSGHMPPWLRKALLDALPEEERTDLRAAVNALLNGKPVLPEGVKLPPEARLPVWRPQTEGLDVPPDAVMADLMMRDENAPTVTGDAFKRIFGPHMRHALTMRGLAMAGVFAWCLAAWWLWPRPADAPHAQGVWLPLILYLVLTILAAAAYFALRRFGHLRVSGGGTFSLAEATR